MKEQNSTLEDSLKQLNSYLTNIAANLPGFVSRPAQKEMMTSVLQTLMSSSAYDKANAEYLTVSDESLQRKGDAILSVEGPTGTGKSLGYILPAIIAAKALKKHLVVSSATVMLQEQLANKDIPFIAKHAGTPITYAIAKGRSRYACIQKLYRFGTRMPQADIFEGMDDNSLKQFEPDQQETQLLSILADAFDHETWVGDKDTLPIKVPDTTWSKITNDRHGCIKRSCPHYKTCPFFEARSKLQEVDIIIANHDLVLADLNMGGGAILTPPNDTFYCIDEAHHFPVKAIQQFAASHTIYGALNWLEKLPMTAAKIETLLSEYWWCSKINTPLDTIVENFTQLSFAFSDFFPALSFEQNKKQIYRCENGKLPERLELFEQNLLPAIRTLLSILSSMRDNIKRQKTNNEDKSKNRAFEKYNIDMGFYVARVENLYAVWTLLSTKTEPNTLPIAKWFSAELTKNNAQVEYTLSASPISAATLLSERFFKKSSGIILTSATLRSLGSFEKFATDTGLSFFEKQQSLALPSPFALEKQGKLIIPEMSSDPTNPEAHTKELIDLIPKLISINNGEGTLVLFSSKKQMLTTAQFLPKSIKEKILMQGTRAKDKLIADHFDRVSNSKTSILFGLASFAEGLDLPGNACTQLIIAKIPFSVPDDPVSATKSEWLVSQRQNPFMKMSLPETSTKLVQAVGRLIRNETDKGVVIILDKRLVKKHYGKLLIRDLPPFELTTHESIC